MDDHKDVFPPPDGGNAPFPDPAEGSFGVPEQSAEETVPEIPELSPLPPDGQDMQFIPQRGTDGSRMQQDAGQEDIPPRIQMPPPVPPQNYTPPPFQYSYPPQPPPVPPQPPLPMDRRIYTMAAVIAVLVFLLCVYCIGSDMLHGAVQGGSAEGTPSRNVTVNLQTQEKPDLDPSDENVTPDGTYTVSGVAELVKPSIVEVYTFDSSSRTEKDLVGTGSGIVISEDGYIITNAHVVQGEAFSVVLNNEDEEEEEYPAELIGSDTKTDLAVLKINKTGLTPAVLGDSDETYVGEDVVAIGNPAGLTNTVTKGIVSAIGRQVRAESSAFRMECIQTDAAISPGNSGGALVNMYGQVIGITSSKYASTYSTSSAYEGLGFAITIDQALPVVTDLIEQGYVSGRFRIGITFSSADTEYAAYEFQEQFHTDMPEELRHGIWISAISDDCDIAGTELDVGDLIVTVEGQPVEGYDDVLDALEGFAGGDEVHAHCLRYQEDGDPYEFDIVFKLEEDTSGNY